MNTKKKNVTKQICVLALLTAAGVVLGRLVPVINLWNTKIEFAFVAVMLAACISGPVGGAVVGALVDFIGAILMPTGAYFPGFTVTAAITGLVFGLLSTQLVCGLLLNTLFISILYTKAFTALLATRAIQFVIMSVVEILFAELALDRAKLLQKVKLA